MATYPALCLNVQMSASSSIYFGFVDGASQRTQNLASAAWVVYSPTDELVSLGGVFLGPVTNNIVEYHTVIGTFD
jgi:ribonuclease HI